MKLIGEFYLYDNQLNGDYLILTNRRKAHEPKEINGVLEFVETDEYIHNLPYSLSQGLIKIFQLGKNSSDEYIRVMEETCKDAGLPLIKLIKPLIFEKIGTTHFPNYNAYEIYYDEGNGDLGEYELAYLWNVGNSFVSTYRLYEYSQVAKLVNAQSNSSTVL